MFFSTPIPKELVNHIKSDTSVLPRIGALREVKIFVMLPYWYFIHITVQWFSSAFLLAGFYFFFFISFFWLANMQMNLEYFPIDRQVPITVVILSVVNSINLYGHPLSIYFLIFRCCKMHYFQISDKIIFTNSSYMRERVIAYPKHFFPLVF